jgi:hypothetical protein
VPGSHVRACEQTAHKRRPSRLRPRSGSRVYRGTTSPGHREPAERRRWGLDTSA